MKIIRKPLFNVFFTLLLSVLYSTLFLVTRNHIEFTRLLPNTKNPTLQSPYWNWWLEFIRDGNIHYIVIPFLIITIIIVAKVVYSMLKSKNARGQYDEYQTSIISRALIISGIASILITPFLLIQYLSDPNYAIPFLFNFAVIQWGIYLIANLIYCLIND